MEFTVDGRRVFAATGGRKFDPDLPTILFVHGAANDHSVWHMPARFFAHRGFSVAAVDLPGHGRSAGAALPSIAAMASWIGRAQAALGVARTHLVGHSMGALVALTAAASKPAGIRRLVLVGPAAAMPVHSELLAAARNGDRKAIDLIIYWGLDHMSRIGGRGSPGMWTPGAGRRLLESAGDGVLATDLAACAAFAEGEALAGAISAPSLLLLGERDMMTPAAGGRTLAGAIPESRTVILPGCGHMMLAERPNGTLDAIRDFLIS